MRRFSRVWLALVVVAALIAAAAALTTGRPPPASPTAQQRQALERKKTALAMYEERCKKSGVFIHRTPENVEGIFLLKVRPNRVNYGDQFALDDPYGHDLMGDGYIESFLRGSYAANISGEPLPGSPPPPVGYQFVDAIDVKDGVRYRYTGSIEEPWLWDKNYLQGYKRFEMRRRPAPDPAPRYGVTYEDISTPEERSYWIAGSSLRVIDLSTNEVMAERVGYMIDLAQGSGAAGRSPWLYALDNACPSLFSNPNPFPGSASAASDYRAARFTEKVLKPKAG